VPLESDFYEKVAEQIRELEDDKKNIEDTYSTKYAILEDELKTDRKAIEKHRRAADSQDNQPGITSFLIKTQRTKRNRLYDAGRARIL